MEIIAPKKQIRKFFFEKHFDFLSSVPQRRLQEIILSSCVKGSSGKMVDYAKTGTVHRTNYGYFWAKGKWDDAKLEETQKRKSFQAILELSRKNKTPLFVSIDDTVLPKTVPSPKAKRPTEGAGWHYSHLEGKVVYGFQVHAAIVGTGDASLCHSPKRCCPESRIDFDLLHREFARANKKNLILKDLQELVCDRLDKMLFNNPNRIKYHERYQAIIEDYNSQQDRANTGPTEKAKRHNKNAGMRNTGKEKGVKR